MNVEQKNNNKKIKKSFKKKAGPYELDVFSQDNSTIIKVYINSEFDLYSCGAYLSEKGLVRLFIYENKKVIVAGYIKSFELLKGYSINEDRFETIKLIPKEERKSLENKLKRIYESVKFWD